MSQAEECPHCGGLFEDREKYRNIQIRAKTCGCDSGGSEDREPSFRHWNKRITPGEDGLSQRRLG